MAAIVMRAALDLPGSHRQQRGCAVQGLDLRLLIDAQDERFIRGMEYSPTISRTFSTNSGSADNLNL